MLDGLPSLFEYVIGLVTRHRRCDSLAVVVHHLLGDIANAADFALTRCLPRILVEPNLQDTKMALKYLKGAEVANRAFENVDQCLQRLVPAAWKLYMDAARRMLRNEVDRGGFRPIHMKDAWLWFDAFNVDYVCCLVNPVNPVLTVSAVNIQSWLTAAGERRVRNRSVPLSEQKVERPPIIAKSAWSISDPAVVRDLQAIGLTRVNELRETNLQYASWLTANCTLEQLVAPHEGTLSDDGGAWHRPRTRG